MFSYEISKCVNKISQFYVCIWYNFDEKNILSHQKKKLIECVVQQLE